MTRKLDRSDNIERQFLQHFAPCLLHSLSSPRPVVDHTLHSTIPSLQPTPEPSILDSFQQHETTLFATLVLAQTQMHESENCD